MQKMAEAVINRYYGVKPESLTSLGGGWYGRVFLAEIAAAPYRVIVKIHLFPDMAEKEAVQLEKLAECSTVKIPAVFHLHKACPDVPYDIILMEFIPGINAGNYSLDEMPDETKAAIAEQMIDNLLSYHSVINELGFGELGSDSFEPDWRKFYKRQADDALSKAVLLRRCGKINEEIFALIRKAHELYFEIFYLPVKEARLVHGDYNPWNILLDEDACRVHAVIDPLNCRFADSEMDLYQLNHANGREYGLLDLYASKFPLSENASLKMCFYELFEHVTHYYDTGVDVDAEFLSGLCRKLENEMRNFGIIP